MSTAAMRLFNVVKNSTPLLIGILLVPVVLNFTLLTDRSKYVTQKVFLRENPNYYLIPDHSPLRAVVHMGIRKTGSTTIQEKSKEHAELLRLDGYEMPWREKNKRSNLEQMANQIDKPVANQINFGSCFIPLSYGERKIHPCNPDLLLHGLDIAKRNRNLLVSAEVFSIIDSEGVDMLASYLSNWDEVTIVVYYRRFHSWIVSLYNQINKTRMLVDTKKWKYSILDFIIKEIDEKQWNKSGYTIPLLQRLKKKFDNVVVMNFHDELVKGPAESFFCHAIPNATHTCEAILAVKKPSHLNVGDNLDYSDVAYGAKKVGLINIKTDKMMKKVVLAVQSHQERTLKLESSDFKRQCLPRDILEKVWEISLSSEIALFPKYVKSTTNNLRSDFDIAAKTTLCKVDVEEILKEEEWQSFFKSYK